MKMANFWVVTFNQTKFYGFFRDVCYFYHQGGE